MNLNTKKIIESVRILGIDEAGRGAVIGPLVICGVVTNEEGIEKLKEIGVKDSKELTPEKRSELAPQIEKIAENVIVLIVPPSKIDANRRRGISLNQIEAIKMADIINMVEPDKVIIDAPGLNTEKFKEFIVSRLRNKDIELICENLADKNYPIVSAASIIAKVERDRKIEELKKKVGYDFGVGYSHDLRTIEFLKKLAKERKGKMPYYVRTTWQTTEHIIAESKQRKILDFLKKIFRM